MGDAMMGDTANATKWHNRIAQGFSPGLVSKRIALKGRPTGLCGRGMCYIVADRLESWFKAGSRDALDFCSGALSGRFHGACLTQG
jgi:hypothetical protein